MVLINSTGNLSFSRFLGELCNRLSYGVQYTHIGRIDRKNYNDNAISEGCEVLWRDGGQTGRWQSLMDSLKAGGATKLRGFWFYDGGDDKLEIDWDFIWERIIRLPKPFPIIDSPIDGPAHN